MSSMRFLIGLVLVSAALLATAWVVATYRLWSSSACLTVPWFCSALAVALLVVGAASAVCQQPPAEMPRKAMWLAYIMAIIVLGVGIVVDATTYQGYPVNGNLTRWIGGLRAGFAEWVGFSILLLGLFWISHLGHSDRR